MRRGVAGEAALAAGVAVAERACAEPTVAAARRVGLYAAFGGELPTRPLFEALVGGGRTLLLPRVRPDHLDWSPAERWDDLVPSGFEIPEPLGETVEAPGPGDLVFVPGLAFDAYGHRLGQGGGYYDRAFPHPDGGPTLVGVAYAFQCVEAVPHDSRDRRVDAIVTEREWIWTPPGMQGSR